MEAHLLRELSAREVRDEKERTARRTQARESSKLGKPVQRQGAKVTEWPPEEDSDEEEITTVRKFFRNKNNSSFQLILLSFRY